MARWEAAIKAVRASEAFVAQKALYDAYVAREVATVPSFFHAKCTSKKKWQLDAGITTDGVSVSLQFSRMVQRKAGGNTEKKALKWKAVAAVSRGEDGKQPLAAVNYDVNMSTFLEGSNICMLGLDPGCCNLATVTYLRRMMRDGKLREYSSTWKLRRNDYRHNGGSRRNDYRPSTAGGMTTARLVAMQDLLQRYRADKAGLLAEWSH